eukprot:7841660-Pyramimonas_sp.AAC.3
MHRLIRYTYSTAARSDVLAVVQQWFPWRESGPSVENRLFGIGGVRCVGAVPGLGPARVFVDQGLRVRL